MHPIVTAVVATAGFVLTLGAQTLVADLHPGTIPVNGSSVAIGRGLSDGQRMFYSGWSQDSGIEPWITDGTAAGTRMLRDLEPGSGNSNPVPLLLVGNRLLLSTNQTSVGAGPARLWVTDGTVAGTLPLFALPGTTGAVRPVGLLPGRVLFAHDGSLLSTDLTAASPRTLAACVVREPGLLLGNRLLFNGEQAATGDELWSTDGTAAGTFLVADLRPGAGGSLAGDFALLGAHVFFLASTTGTASTVELWRTDGTAAGTSLVLATAVQRQIPYETLVACNGSLLAVAGNSLWRSDGTAAGTSLVVPGNAAVPVRQLVTDGSIAFCGRGNELWRSDGTAAGTTLVTTLSATVNLGASATAPFLRNGRLFLPGGGGGAAHLITSDGTAAGTTTQSFPGAFMFSIFQPLGNGVLIAPTLLSPAVSTPALQFSDGTAAGTRTLAGQSALAGVRVQRSTTMDGVLYTFLDDGSGQFELWRSDGTAAGTRRVLTPGGPTLIMGPTDEMIALDGALYFTGRSATAGHQLWRTDGTAAGTTLVYLPNGSIGTVVSTLRTSGHELFFIDFVAAANHYGIFRSDGTALGTAPIGPVQHAATASPYALLPGVVVYQDRSAEVWRSDGTIAGTSLLLARFPRHIATLGNLALVVAETATTGELFGTDGTVAGTQLLASGLDFLDEVPVFWQGRACWITDGEFVSTDGTPAGTTRNPFSLRPIGRPLPTDNFVCFVAEDLTHGRELWRTDGTQAGTAMVTDLAPSFQNGVVRIAKAGFGNQLVVTASDGIAGADLWLSEGTAVFPLPDLSPLGSSNPEVLGVAGDRLFLLADHPAAGRELHVMPIGLTGNGTIESLGIGCAGSQGIPALGAVGEPRVGALSFAFTAAQLRPASPCLLALGLQPAAQPLSGGCLLLVGQIGATVFAQSGFAGTASFAAPIPNNPLLLGMSLVAQVFALDPAGTALPSVSTSNGLLVAIAR